MGTIFQESLYELPVSSHYNGIHIPLCDVHQFTEISPKRFRNF